MPALDDKSDLELLLDYSRAKSHAAFEALVRRHGSMVHGVAMRALSNHHDAQDVTQATFLVLAREASKLTRSGSLAGWLHTVARRLSLNALKSRKLREEREQDAMNNEASSNTAGAGFQAEFGRELDAAISQLPERYRQPLVLFHLEGASLHEASQRLNLHPGTLRTRLVRARAQLRDVLMSRGVEVASVSMLVGMLATTSKASAFGAATAHGISQAVLGNSLTAGAHSLAQGFGRVHSLSASSLITSSIVVMKTKVTIIAASVIAIAALVAIATKLASHQQSAELSESERQRLVESRPESPRSRGLSNQSNGATRRVVTHDLSDIATFKDIRRHFESVFLIADERQRLQAFRQRLGMNLSDQVYRSILEECRYENHSSKQLRILFEKWTEEDAEGVMQWAQNFPKELRADIELMTLTYWQARDQDAALAWASAKYGPEELEDLQKLMHREPYHLLVMPADQLIDYMATLPLNKSSEEAERGLFDIGDVISEYGYKNPEAMFEIVKSSGFIDSRNSSSKIRKFFKHWAGRDPDAALAAAMENLEGDMRQNAMLEVLECWQIKYPHRSLDEVVDLSVFSDKQRHKLALSTAANHARLDPEGALQQAMRASSPEKAGEMLDAVMEVTVLLAEEQTRDWVADLPEGEKKDMGLQTLAKALVNYDLESGVELVTQISNQKRRGSAAAETLRRYVQPTGGDMALVMHLADQAGTIPVDNIGKFTNVAELDEIDGFIDWLRERHSEGRIKDEDVGSMDRIMRDLKQRQEELERGARSGPE